MAKVQRTAVLEDARAQDSIPLSASYRAEPQSAGEIRADLRVAMDGWGVGEDVAGTVELLATELLANALRHGAPLAGNTVHVNARLRNDGDAQLLRVEVEDADPASADRVRARKAGDDEECGRGLSLVELLGARLGVCVTGCMKAVWFELPTA